MKYVMSEREFTDTVVQLAKFRGWKVTHFLPALNKQGKWRTPLQGHAGFVDLVLARNGVVIHAELKTEIGKPTLAQQEWGVALGDTYRLWRPSDIPAITKELM